MREIVFDTETTGLDVNTGHRIVELGCVELIDKVKTGRVFHRYINPQRDIPKASEQVHGLTEQFLSDKPVFKEVAEEFMAFISKDVLVIHNASFDMKFINFELDRVNIPPIPFMRAVDTLEIARKKFPGAKASLDALCSRFNISLEKRDKHGALLDAELLADVYIELVGGAQGMMALESVAPKAEGEKKVFGRLEPRAHTPSSEELEAHALFLKKIKEPVWQ